MSFSTLLFTEKGRALQAKALAGVPLQFTHISMGSGSLDGQSPVTLVSLIDPKVTLNIAEIKRDSNYATVKGNFSNADISTGFYWREIGVFAQDPDKGEILYCYGNAGSLAEYIPPQSSEIIEKVVGISVIVGDATAVSARINETLVYATKADIIAIDEDIALHTKEGSGYGVVSGLTVAAQAIPNMTVKVAAGIIYNYNGVRLEMAENNALAINAANSTYPRIDVVYVSEAGVLEYQAGVPVANPTPAIPPQNALVLAYIHVAANATAISTANITDARTMKYTNNNLIPKANIANNLLSDNANLVLGAPQGKVLKTMIDTTNDNLAVQTFAPTIASNFNAPINNMTKYGKIIVFNLALTTVNTITTDVTIATFPFAPDNRYDFNAFIDGVRYDALLLFGTTDLKTNAWGSIAAGKTVWISGTYIVN